MKITDLKTIMKEVNEPNEFELFQLDPNHPYYWIYKVENVRIKTISPVISELRKAHARFDVFINGLFISNNDYILEESGNDFIIKFKKANFPEYDRFGNVYQLDETDEVKAKGDLERVNNG